MEEMEDHHDSPYPRSSHDTTKERLNEIRKSLLDASNSTLNVSSFESALTGITLKSPTSTIIENDSAKKEEDSHDRRAAFEIGMTLFGDDALQDEIELKLNEVESELRQIIGVSPAIRSDRVKEEDEDEKDNENEEEEEEEDGEAQRLLTKVQFLRKCSEGRSLMDQTTMGRKGGGLVESASTLSQTRDVILEAESLVSHLSDKKDIEVAHRISHSIRGEMRRRHTDLRARASLILDECVVVTSSKISVLEKSSKGEGGFLALAYDVLLALSSEIDILGEVIHSLSDNLNKIVLQPLLDSRGTTAAAGKDQNQRPPIWQFREVSSADDDKGKSFDESSTPTVTLEWRRRTTAATTPKWNNAISDPHLLEGDIAAWVGTIHAIKTVMEFVHQRILLKRPDLCEMMGKCLFGETTTDSSMTEEGGPWEPLTKKLLRIMRDTCVPDTPSRLSELGASLLSVTGQFERDLMERNFIQTSSKETLLLSNFARNFVQEYAQKRRSVLLSRGRNILLKDDYHNTIIVGDSTHHPNSNDDFPTQEYVMEDEAKSVFYLPQCAISKVASNLMILCRQTLDEAVSDDCPESTAPTLYRTSRELLDLFRAIIPAAHGTGIATIPRTAAVLHNDCVYLAHNMLTLGLEYKEKFSEKKHPVLYQICTFVDFVPVFREMADQVMVSMIQRQKHQLADIVGDRVKTLRDALKMNEGVTEWTEAETGVRAAHYHLHHLSQAWKPILSRDVYGRSMGSLVDTLLSLLLDQILKASDISEAASHFVSSLFRDVLQTSELFVGGFEEARRYCNLWERFTAIGRFMEMSLADISLALSEGVFRSVTGPELKRLIMAAFNESEKRKKILMALTTE